MGGLGHFCRFRCGDWRWQAWLACWHGRVLSCPEDVIQFPLDLRDPLFVTIARLALPPVHDGLGQVPTDRKERFPRQKNDEHHQRATPKTVKCQYGDQYGLQGNPDFRLSRNHRLLTSVKNAE
jgi:hypothetical protein